MPASEGSPSASALTSPGEPVGSGFGGGCPELAGHRRIIEWFGLEGTLKIIWFQPSCHGQGHLPPAQGAQSSIQPGLEHFHHTRNTSTPLRAELVLSFSKSFEASSARPSSLAPGDEESVRFCPLQKPSQVSIVVLFGRRCGGIQECPRDNPSWPCPGRRPSQTPAGEAMEDTALASHLLPFHLALHDWVGWVAWP